jgi:hypothetical protein
VRNLAMTADERDIRMWDGILAFWVVFWLVMGAVTAVVLWNLSGLAASAVESGRALDSAGQALQGLGSIPIIGSGPGEFGTNVRATAEGIIANGESAGRSIHVLAILLGLSIAILPITPVIGFYLPVRLARRRDVRQIRQVLATEGLTPALQDYLARRAGDSMSFRELSSVVDAAAPTARDGALARAELARLGLRAPGDRPTRP